MSDDPLDIAYETPPVVPEWRRMRFLGAWDVNEIYIEGDVVVDGPWTMFATRPTYDRPAPQPLHDPTYALDARYPGGVPWTTGNVPAATQISAGQRVVWGPGGWINRVRVWCKPDFTYQAVLVRDPTSENPDAFRSESFTVTTEGWQEVMVSAGPLIIRSGQMFDVLFMKSNQGTEQPPWVGNWDYQRPNNETIPLSGQITHSNKSIDQLWIHKTDFDGGDRAAELANLRVGDDIISPAVPQQITWNIEAIVDEGTWVRFDVTPLVQFATTGVSEFTFQTYAAIPMDFVEVVDEWLNNPPTGEGTTVQGFGLEDSSGYDPNNLPLDNNQYGIEVQFQEAVVSDDWEAVSYSTF